MENVILKNAIIERLQDILGDVIRASNLVENGKEVPADRKLQGVRTRMVALIKDLQKEVTEMTEATTEEVTVENVAQTNLKT